MASAESLGGDKTVGKLRLGVASGGKIPKSFHFFGEFAVRTTVSVDISGTTGPVRGAPGPDGPVAYRAGVGPALAMNSYYSATVGDGRSDRFDKPKGQRLVAVDHSSPPAKHARSGLLGVVGIRQGVVSSLELRSAGAGTARSLAGVWIAQ